MTAPNPGDVLPVPLVLSPQWQDGEQIHDRKLSSRVVEPLNDVQRYLGNWGAQFMRYFGYSVGQTYAAGDEVNFTTAIDNLGVWGDIPSTALITQPGLYFVSTMLVSHNNAAVRAILQTAIGDATDPTWVSGAARPVGTAAGQASAATSLIRLRRDETLLVSVTTVNAITTTTTAGQIRSFLSITQLGGCKP